MTLTFTGDTSITGAFIKKVENNEEIFSKGIISSLESSDFVVCNLEGPVTLLTPKASLNVKLKSPKNTIDYLSKRNITIFNIANNHILDCDKKGLEDTISEIQKNNCLFFGGGNNINEVSNECILINKSISVALFGLTVSRVNNKKEPETIYTKKHLSILKKKISELRNKVDYIIISYHGGEEFTNYPSPTKRRFLKKMAKINDIDIIISHHSHTLQSYEKYNNTYIFYSLGNFIFDIPGHYPYLRTDESALVKFNFNKNNFTFDFIPFTSKNGKISNSNDLKFNTYFKKISDFSNYKQKWREEAYRVLFRYNHLKTDRVLQTKNKKTLQEKSIFEIALSKKFYIKAFKILFSDNYRPLYLSAIIHKVMLKIKFK